jgi:hypothetical protein
MNFLSAESGRDPSKQIARDFQLLVSVFCKRDVRAADDKAAKYNLDTRDQHMSCERGSRKRTAALNSSDQMNHTRSTG